MAATLKNDFVDSVLSLFHRYIYIKFQELERKNMDQIPKLANRLLLLYYFLLGKIRRLQFYHFVHSFDENHNQPGFSPFNTVLHLIQ